MAANLMQILNLKGIKEAIFQVRCDSPTNYLQFQAQVSEKIQPIYNNDEEIKLLDEVKKGRTDLRLGLISEYDYSVLESRAFAYKRELKADKWAEIEKIFIDRFCND